MGHGAENKFFLLKNIKYHIALVRGNVIHIRDSPVSRTHSALTPACFLVVRGRCVVCSLHLFSNISVRVRSGLFPSETIGTLPRRPFPCLFPRRSPCSAPLPDSSAERSPAWLPLRHDSLVSLSWTLTLLLWVDASCDVRRCLQAFTLVISSWNFPSAVIILSVLNASAFTQVWRVQISDLDLRILSVAFNVALKNQMCGLPLSTLG